MTSVKTLAIALLFSPTFAMACPDLSGNYSCRYKSFTRAIEVTQSKNSGVTIYQVDNGGDIIADGQPHRTDSLHPMLDMYASNYEYTAKCSGNAVKVSGTADINSGGSGKLTGELLKTGTDLAVGMRLVTSTRTMDITLACTKK